ncbi:MAG: tetratricopeptide repeat protein [Sphingomonadaceae bacterium]|nr:tetratricopeptide repeat protein [Sphingomonadaceae bacterium]
MFLAFAALLATQTPAVPAGSVAQPARISTATGYYAGVDETGGETRLKLDDTPHRYRVPRLAEAELRQWAQLISTAAQRGFALRVRFDGTAGRVDAQDATITYPICSLSVGSLQPLGDEAANCPTSAAVEQRRSFALMAQGFAARAQPRLAIGLLDEALADEHLPANVRAIGLRARTEANEAVGLAAEWAGAEYDRFMLAALTDARARVAITPDDAEAYFEVGFILTNLGAYDDALAVYANMARRWPGEAFRIAVREGAIYRLRGDYRRALAALDDFAARSGRPDGMRFAYHRAWTLLMLDRYREALAEIDRGLESQPDYASAWELRSCANAQLGATDVARSDQERALELFEDIARNGAPGVREGIDRSRRLVALLRGTTGRASAELLDLACREPWRNYTRTRARSPLLGAR